MILESVENGLLLWPTVEENRLTRPKKYSELSATEAIQADCDVKAPKYRSPRTYTRGLCIESNLSSSTTIVEVLKELPKVRMVNSSLKKLKFHLASFDMAVEQHCVEKNKFQDKMNDILKENERLLEEAISVDIVNIVVNANVNYACQTVNECAHCVTIENKLQRDFIKRECYDKLLKQYTTLEKHCISLEFDNQLKQELFQRNNSFSQQSAPTFDQLFEINDLKAQSQEKDMVIMKLKERIKSLSGNVKKEKIKREFEEIETINIELDHRVTKLVAENEHLKQNYKQLYDSIKSSLRNVCPLTRITTTSIVPLRKPIPIKSNTTKPVVTLVYLRKSKAAKKKVPVSNSKINKSLVVQIVLWYLDSGCSKHMTGDRSQLINFVHKFLGTIKFGNDHVAKIMGYGDYKIGNVTILRVYFVEGLWHNLLSVGQFCDSDLEVKCLRSKDEALDFIIKFLKMIQVRIKVLIPHIQTNNGTEFVNQMLREYYEEVGISHETSVARSPQQNSVIERRNRMLIEAARTISGPALNEITSATISSGLNKYSQRVYQSELFP
nr:integrase, catalytic region, zinc finger, CCHC-type, peptidase aspartic, catalytic [Tanacetum cinerariifolium]